MLTKKPKFVVLESDGVHGRFFNVKQVLGYNNGYAYIYKNGDGLEDMVLAGMKYKALEVDGTHIIGKRQGNDSACCLCKLHTESEMQEIDIPGKGKVKVSATQVIGNPSDPDCPGEDLSALGRANFFGIGVRSIYKPFDIPWKIIGIVGIGIIAVIIFVKVILPSIGG